MAEIIKYGAEVLGWQRPPGPIRTWRVVEGRKKTEDGQSPRFSIQEIPEDRYGDVLHHMMTIFTRDEPICRSNDTSNNPEELEEFRKLWSFAFGQGIMVGAFLVDENNPKPILAGVNMTICICEAARRGFESGVRFHTRYSQLILNIMHKLEEEQDTLKIYNVDKYISAFGLSVDPRFRGQGLGYELLDARKEMGAAYGIDATSTIFTAPAAQRIAAKLGYELLAEAFYDTYRWEDGSACFPNIESKSMRLMALRLK